MPEGGENAAASSAAAGEEGSSEQDGVREGFKAELRGHGFIPLPVGLALPKGTELCVDRNNAARYSRHKAREGGFVTVKLAAPADAFTFVINGSGRESYKVDRAICGIRTNNPLLATAQNAAAASAPEQPAAARPAAAAGSSDPAQTAPTVGSQAGAGGSVAMGNDSDDSGTEGGDGFDANPGAFHPGAARQRLPPAAGRRSGRSAGAATGYGHRDTAFGDEEAEEEARLAEEEDVLAALDSEASSPATDRAAASAAPPAAADPSVTPLRLEIPLRLENGQKRGPECILVTINPTKSEAATGKRSFAMLEDVLHSARPKASLGAVAERQQQHRGRALDGGTRARGGCATARQRADLQAVLRHRREDSPPGDPSDQRRAYDD